jgi:hypothetical protein
VKTKLDELEVRASASTSGKITNRVKVARTRKYPPGRVSPQELKRAKDEEAAPRSRARRRPYAVIGVSVYVDDLAIIDAGAAHANMNRSQFLAYAARELVKSMERSSSSACVAEGACEP